MKNTRVIYEVEEINDKCPVYKIGDKIVIDSPKPGMEIINVKESNDVCARAVECMWSRVVWQFGNSKIVEHMYGITGECRIACPMPGEPYTPCGRVTFRIRRENIE
jgi:uncharacterized repeat protein (TIGR04076 family)